MTMTLRWVRIGGACLCPGLRKHTGSSVWPAGHAAPEAPTAILLRSDFAVTRASMPRGNSAGSFA